MSGKSYTMKEMKVIVDYLLENKAFSELKGRKMWMNFANSRFTNRSWQSLKETFLKRILPDIHNPYYKLSHEQICSFRQGYDVIARENNKLEIHTISEDSSSNAETPKDNEVPSTSKASNGTVAPGEAKQSSKSRDRASVDTVIIENCYDTAEDVQRVLESPKSNSNIEIEKSPSRSLRDLLTYSEPLTPMLQEVLHDFATDEDSDSGEPQMQIVETENEPDSDPRNGRSKLSPRRIPSPDEVKEDTIKNTQTQEADSPKKFVQPKIKSLRLRKKENAAGNKLLYNIINGEDNCDKTQPDTSEVRKDTSEESIANLKTDQELSKTENCSSSTTDTLLPNNQEQLKKSLQNINKSDENLPSSSTVSKNDNNKSPRKRASSQDVHAKNKKNKKSNMEQKQISMSDTDICGKKRNSTPLKPINENVTEKIDNINKITTEKQENTAKELSTDSVDPVPDSQVNPCLQSVSLYAEQFNLTNYLDSESSSRDETSNVQPNSKGKQEKEQEIIKTANVSNEVVILKSHSESGSESEKVASEMVSRRPPATKPQRNRTLAKIFGFSSDAVKTKNKKRPCFQKRSIQQYVRNSSTESSEWTSESESDYVSPPRGRRNRRGRKYLKPKSSRIHSLQDDGGLFVMYGKKIYPLVKDGKSIKNYLTYWPESDLEEDDNYWKLKYVEEKKRVDSLKKFIQREKQEIVRNKSPILATKQLAPQPEAQESVAPSTSLPNHNCGNAVPEPQKASVEKPVEQKENKTLKITFAKNNQEVHLEGHWSQLHPVLEDVVKIFHKDTDTSARAPSVQKEDVEHIEVSSEKSSVAPDEDVREKVNQIETEIFKEIEERDQEDIAVKQNDVSINVTKRKRTPKLSEPSSSTRISSEKQSSPDSSQNPKRAKVAANTETKPQTREAEVRKSTRAAKEPVPVKVTESKTRSHRSKANMSKVEEDDVQEDSAVRYMFPPSKKNSRKTTSIGKNRSPTKRYPEQISSIYTSPNMTLHSESTQGYVDSDISPPKYVIKKKRRLSLSSVINKNRNKQNRYKRRSLPHMNNDASSDSNNSTNIVVTSSKNESTLKSDAYKSESYQLLMPSKKNPFVLLEKIDEDLIMPYSTKKDSSKLKDDCTVANGNTDGNSSNVSLPLSPELSIVENLSLSKDLISNINIPTLNEMQNNNDSENMIYNKFLISQVDITMPLMQQECGVHRSFSDKMNQNYLENLKYLDSEVLHTINFKELSSFSESLDTRLKNLLLDSAKKISPPTMEKEKVDTKTVPKKSFKKRCSTPHKKKEPKKSKKETIDTVVEENVQLFAPTGRKSCPPVINIIANNALVEEKEIPKNKSNNVETKVKKKKDIIKVKILRPRDKSRNREKSPRKSNGSKAVPGDSGINETGSGLSSNLSDSVDLIHNHSETCLQANECFGDSIEFIETNCKSIISINSNESNDKLAQENCVFQDCMDMLPDMLCSNAQDQNVYKGVPTHQKSENTSDTVYHSPVLSELSLNSLITEDLSDEVPRPPSQSNNWYLLSEDETNTANLWPQNFGISSAGCGSNLKQLFPITCAVPDLSTISETSKENDSCKKQVPAYNTASNDFNFDSQNFFDF